MDKKTIEGLIIGLNECNCNARIDRLTDIQNRIGKIIDKLIMREIFESEYDNLYDFSCDIMDKLCEYRRTHKCLIQGDPGYCNN